MPSLRFTSSNTGLFKAYTNLFCSQNFSSPKRVKSKTQIFCLPLCFCFSILLRFTKNRGGLQHLFPLPLLFCVKLCEKPHPSIRRILSPLFSLRFSAVGKHLQRTAGVECFDWTEVSLEGGACSCYGALPGQ